ncbi:Conserved_hypothetical protein [Hexamita inflata]|uniref:Uncharacterized protein n=1 Tax=Hexamita inflata TaxID=28002 RepID=A0AA86UAJ2_9EUKA|nr:Conserved hypothetical protein [Hexamita inflata]
MNSSGIANAIKQSAIQFTISQCKLSGSNLIFSPYNGYIVSKIFIVTELHILEFYICVDIDSQRFGQDSVQINTIGSESVQCDICNNQTVLYGLCAEELKFSENISGMFQCQYPFEYVSNQCVCIYGYFLNNSKCINIVDSLNNLNTQISTNNNQTQQLQQQFENIGNLIKIIDLYILNNVSELENRILSNFSISDFNLLTNTSVLDKRIYENISLINNEILITQVISDINLLSNTTVLDWRIFNNATQCKNNINNLTVHLSEIEDSIIKQTQIIEQQQNIINNLTLQINCTNNYGYQILNGSCVPVTCAVSGQHSINGICQCVNINSVIYAGSCVCPVNSQILGSTCVCSIIGQTLQNGICTCSTAGAFVDDNVCTCGVNALNISNTCVCPENSSFVNNICTCDIIIGQQIINGSCQCPSGQTLVNNSCHQTNYIINISNFECSQNVFTQSFDIQSITNEINSSNNFNDGYVFDIITNAFIDISDNIYSDNIHKLEGIIWNLNFKQWIVNFINKYFRFNKLNEYYFKT